MCGVKKPKMNYVWVCAVYVMCTYVDMCIYTNKLYINHYIYEMFQCSMSQ